MAQILTYAAGVERQGRDGMTGRERQAKAIMNLAQKFSRDMQGNALEGIRASQQEAQIDALQGTIDPKRKENDEAYAATILRNTLNEQNQKMQAELDNPAGELANMDPTEYRKYLGDQAKDFYKSVEGSKHVETQSRVFTTYTAKNMPGLIAKQAKMYKDNVKSKQGQAAVVALAALPPGEGDAFALNTDYLISEMLPSDRFTSTEKLGVLLGAALGAANQGDRRLLDHVEERYDAEALMPVKVQQAENAFTKATREKEAAAWAEGRNTREQLALDGAYTTQMYDKDSRDPEVVKQYGIGTIDGWRKTAHTQHIQQLNYADGMARFMAGDVLTGFDDKTQQQIFRDAKRNLLQEAAKSGNQDAVLSAISQYAGFMGRQGVADKELKRELGSRLNRPVFTKDAFMDTGFQEALVTFEALDKVLTPSQMIKQVGDEAYSNGMLASQFMTDAGGDPEKAVDAYLIAMNTAKAQPALKTPKMHKEELAVGLQQILSGELEGSDPAASKFWAMSEPGESTIHTGQLEYEVQKQYGIERGRNLSHEKAMELSFKKVAAKTKYFGNEMIFTEGADLTRVTSMPYGSTDDDLQKAWEHFATELKLDPQAAHFQIAGQYGYVTDNNGEPFEGQGVFPLFMVGQAYEQLQRDDFEEREARDLEDKLNDVAIGNRLFETSLNARTGFDDDAVILKDGTTLGNLKNSDEEGRLLIRKQYEEETRGVLGKFVQQFVGWTHDIQSGKYKDDWKRFDSITSADVTLTEPPSKDVAVPTELAFTARQPFQRPKPEGQLYSSRDDYQNAVDNEAEQDDVAAFKAEQAAKDYNPRKYAIKPTPENNEKMMNDFVKMGGMKKLSEAEKVTVKHENAYSLPYEDKKGKLTIGIGHNLDANPFDAEELKRFGKNRDWAKKPMTRNEMVWLFKRDMKRAAADVKTNWPQAAKLSKKRRDVLVDMMFNMGATSFEKENWKRFNENLTAFVNGTGSLEDVIKEMKNSDWHNKDVPERAAADIKIFRKG